MIHTLPSSLFWGQATLMGGALLVVGIKNYFYVVRCAFRAILIILIHDEFPLQSMIEQLVLR